MIIEERNKHKNPNAPPVDKEDKEKDHIEVEKKNCQC